MVGKPYSPELLDLLEEALDGYQCQRRNMFGCPVFFAGGSMFCGVDEDTIFIRLSESDREGMLVEYDEVRPFDPTGEGKPMKEYLVVPELFHGRMDLLLQWIHLSYEYARTLPVKKKASAKKPARKKKQ
jgi:TfoX/Sxy family transcriptional regulator of competence genes